MPEVVHAVERLRHGGLGGIDRAPERRDVVTQALGALGSGHLDRLAPHHDPVSLRCRVGGLLGSRDAEPGEERHGGDGARALD